MTKEEAIKQVELAFKVWESKVWESIYGAIRVDWSKEHEAKDMAIKALEQEQILDKIKPIVAEWKTNTWTNNFSCECMIKIAEIIDKAESEG